MDSERTGKVAIVNLSAAATQSHEQRMHSGQTPELRPQGKGVSTGLREILHKVAGGDRGPMSDT